MKHILIALLVGLLSGCKARAPAKITFHSVDGNRNKYEVFFSSHTNILHLREGSIIGDNISTNLICSIEDVPDFDSENDHRNIASGVIEPSTRRFRHASGKYQFRARLLFIDPVKSTTQTIKILPASSIDAYLASHSSMTCKVRVLAYLSAPYYSEAMLIPTIKIRELTQRSAQ